MGDWTKLTAADGHELGAYVATPAEEPLGAVIVLQEIFGVNAYMRSVVESFAKDGFLAIAPALFDRQERGVELEYEGKGREKAFEFYGKLDPKLELQDIAAAYEFLKKAGKKIGVVGFCYGGFLSWLTATRGEQYGMKPDACVAYYGGGIGKVATEEPSCPVMLHFGKEDSHIGPEQAEAVRVAHPKVEIFEYEGAGHAFMRDVDPASYNEDAARTARARTLEFFKTHIS